MEEKLYTKEHVEKLIELAFIKGQEYALQKTLVERTVAVEFALGNKLPETLNN